MYADLYTTKGCYAPGEAVELRLECGEIEADEIRITIYRLGRVVHEFTLEAKSDVMDISLPPVDDDFAGFGVKAVLEKSGQQLQELYTAFDISKGLKVLRYGFLSDFTDNDKDSANIEHMAKYHINTVQFYDWSYRPDSMVAPIEHYQDLMGKEISLSAVKQKIQQCHERGMRALGYGAVYAASSEYRSAHPEQSLFAAGQTPLCFIGQFFVMNISRNSAWHNHIIDQYKYAAEQVGFDGMHMDTYGFPKVALDCDGEVVKLDEHFNTLISDTRDALSVITDSPCLIFNNVGGWPAEVTRYALQDCVYIEVWPPYERYYQLKQLIQGAGGSGKPVVLAAYPTPFRTDTSERALESELLCSLVIAFNGATQLFLGENNAIITQGYYSDYTVLDELQARKIRNYQDFFVQYEELLYDESLKDVSLSHAEGDNIEYSCSTSFSVAGQADKLWLNIREKDSFKVIGIVNLCNNNDIWNEGKNPPKVLEEVVFKVLTLSPIKSVWFSSPDNNGREALGLSVQYEDTDKGRFAKVAVPCIDHGGLLWMEV